MQLDIVLKHSVKLTIVIISCIILFTGSQAAAALLTPNERAWLKNHPELRIAPDPDFPPIEFIDSDGHYRGIAADYLALLEQKLGIDFTIVQLPSWDEALKQAQNRQVDMFSAATSTPQREKYMTFTAPHIELPGVILVRKQVDKQLSIKDLYKLKVAVVSGYVWQELISHDHPDIVIEPVPDLLTGLRKVSFGTVDAMVANLATATHYIEKAGITNLRVAGETGYYGRYAFGIRNDWPQLSNILNKGLAAITEQERAVILKKWIRLQTPSLLSSKSFWITLLTSLSIILVISILIWNWSLRKTVEKRTIELREELSQRMRAEYALQASEQRYYTLFDLAPDAIFLLENERFVDCNHAALTMFACSYEEFLRTPPYLLSPEQQPDGKQSEQKALQLIEDAYNTGRPIIFEWQHRRLDKSLFDAEVSLNAFDANGHKYILGIVRDISVRKHTQRLKDEFLSTVSHEIRTPLTSIRGSLGLLKGKLFDLSPFKVNQLVEIAHDNTERLLILVNDLLDIQKLESGELQLELRPVNIAEFLQKITAANHHYVTQRRIKFQLLPVDTSLIIMADSDRLMQVMHNLLSNAAKFSPDDSTVTIKVSQHDSRLRISVVDQGTGIPEAFRPYLFNRFTQADASDTRQVGGTGLGLCIAKAIVERHLGQIGFDPSSEHGTEFYFELPLTQ